MSFDSKEYLNGFIFFTWGPPEPLKYLHIPTFQRFTMHDQ